MGLNMKTKLYSKLKERREEAVRDICSVSVSAAPKSKVKTIFTSTILTLLKAQVEEYEGKRLTACPLCNGLGHTGHSNFGHTDEGECTQCPVQCDMCPVAEVIINETNRTLDNIISSLKQTIKQIEENV